MRTSHKTVRVFAVVALLSTAAFVDDASAWDTNPLNIVVTSQHHVCGTNDLPEGVIQGDVPKADQDSGRAQKGYNCGLALLGHTQLTKEAHGATRAAGNANMAWVGHCAYVAGSAGVSIAPQSKPSPPPNAGVAVVSVSSDGTPTYVATLRNPGAVAPAEAIHAVTTPGGRSILVVGQYGNDVVSDPKPMDVYDVSNRDCTKFKHISNPDFPKDPTKATYYWPANIHNLTISQDGRYVFATLPLQAIDISGLFDHDPRSGVKYLGNIQDAMDGPPVATGPVGDLDDNLPPQLRSQTHPVNSSHEAWPSPDGKTLYVGGSTAEFEIFTIIDISRWLARNPDGSPKAPPRVISQESGRGHSVRTATIGGVPYVLHSEESVFGAGYGCIPQEAAPFAGPAQPWLTNISDPAHPKTVSQFGLQINDPKNCQEQFDGKQNDSVHYHDVDDPSDTTFVMASIWNAGIRMFDVRHPEQPTEVAYFNPGDVDPTASVQLDHAWGHVRYIAKSGQIWFATADGGFWVVRIEGQVRRYLGLDAKNVRHGLPALNVPVRDSGRPGTIGASLLRPVAGWLDIAPYYCTLGSVAGAPTAPGQPGPGSVHSHAQAGPLVRPDVPRTRLANRG